MQNNTMKILRAEHLGMCFGVRDAIELARATADREPLTILGDLVHNEVVLEELRRQGIQFQQHLAHVATPTVMITAHGTAQKTLAATQARGFKVIEATCPLVHGAHRALHQLVAGGAHPVVIGQRDHVEVRGLTGDLAACDVVLTAEEVEQLTERPCFGVVAQTTQPIQRVRALVQLIRRRFPQSEVRWVDTVCQPTKQRQQAAGALAQRCDIVIVIGGAHSNNTKELVATCRAYCARVQHVQTAAELRPEWFGAADTVGITAGTSTPDNVIAAVVESLQVLAQTIPTPQA